MNNKLKDNLFALVTSVAIVVAVVLVNVVLYSITAINGWYKSYANTDLDLTIGDNTDALFADAIAKGRKVEIIFCMPEDELAVHTTGKDVYSTAKQFEERYPDFIELKFFNIRTMQDDDKNIFDFEKYKYDGLGNEIIMHKGSVIFTSTVREGGLEREDYTVLSTVYNGVPFVDFYHLDSEGYISAYNGEETIASRILWTLTDEHKIAYFTTGHGESVDAAFTNMLASAGYYVQMVDLVRNDIYSSSKINDKDELKNKKGLDLDRAGLVVISNPTADFTKGADGVRAEIDKLEHYLSEGGSLYVTLDPYTKPLSNLEELLGTYGMKLSVSESKDGKIVRNIVKDPKNAITTDGYTFVANYAENEAGDKLGEKTNAFVSDDVVVKNSSEIVLSGGAKPVLVASSAAVTVADGSKVDGEGGYCVAAISEKTAGEKTSRIFLATGVYLTASDAVISDSYANRNFVYALFDSFFDAPVAPYGCTVVPYDTGRLEDLTMGTARVYTALIMAIPVILTVGGIVINKRRKNR